MTARHLRDALDAVLREHHDRLAVGSLTHQMTYRELDDASAATAREIAARGWRRVALKAGSSPRYVVSLLAVLRAGAVPFLVDPALSPDESGRLAKSCGIDATITDGDSAGPDLTIQPITRSGSAPDLLPDTEVCRFSSGSTRTPGCIEFSGSAVRNAAAAWTEASGLHADDVILCFAGLYNGLAFNTSLIPGLLAGASLWLPRGLPSASHVQRYVATVQPSILVGFPALYDGLARRAGGRPPMTGIRIALSSAAQLSEDTARTVAEHDGMRIADYYGIAETGPLTFDPDPRPGGGQGALLPGVEVRVVSPDGPGAEHGELEVRSRSMGSRYLNYPGEMERRITVDGFYRTGDEGSIADGRLRLTGRSGRHLNIGGRKVSAEEIVDVIRTHPAVRDCVVFGATNQSDAAVIAAAVVADGALTVEDVRRFCLSRMAAFKVPERIAFTDRIPRSGAGKPLAGALSALLTETRPAGGDR
ncbi:class I adenylate-forming enzyme family protein [Micromonospora ureilytica]|uniref:class I adenylate-forming enzyme family protein n=1 Tax=Micromonospora ureilytica TaxID=709868 RepID=UPI002E0E33B9|nr:acyl--CoA ligase [Micromonospora ureilytica]